MIRKYAPEDCDRILQIWLSASIEAHHFIEADYWESQVEDMRTLYLPAAETYVCEESSIITGFYSLMGNSLAAIFVSPEFQGKGVGKELIHHAKKQRDFLTLSVYKENELSYQFYLSQGFKKLREQTDEHTGHGEFLMSNRHESKFQ